MKTALVTGAQKGLGFEWCRQLGKRSYSVFLCSRNQNDAIHSAELLSKEGYEVIPLQLDPCSETSISEAMDTVKTKYGKLDLLVNNAGMNSGTRAKGNPLLLAANLSLDTLQAEEVLEMIRVNAIAPILIAKHFRKLLAASEEGRIINIGSWLGSISIKKSGGNYSYAVSKSALNMMNRALAFDLIGDGIVSVVVNPGWVQTDMGGGKATFTAEDAVQNLIENVLEKLKAEDCGKFLNYDGTEHPW